MRVRAAAVAVSGALALIDIRPREGDLAHNDARTWKVGGLAILGDERTQQLRLRRLPAPRLRGDHHDRTGQRHR
ncbi:hypothetical protein [Streptomyces sp. NPDC012510]|uniref:hypothetical protein n=1 Tax=Streptomyces sp. NPDC012510 TaxID=3364838 RepID=UPI0036E694BC